MDYVGGGVSHYKSGLVIKVSFKSFFALPSSAMDSASPDTDPMLSDSPACRAMSQINA